MQTSVCTKQYCRYCNNAFDYNGEASDFLCFANAPCGNNGAGCFYDAAKAKRANKCSHFVFNPLDIFYTTYGEREYKPRQKREAPADQLTLECVVKEEKQ